MTRAEISATHVRYHYTPPYQHERPLDLDLSAVSSLRVSSKVAAAFLFQLALWLTI